MSQTHKPFIKWVGGKTQLMATLTQKVPLCMKNYREPFLGGGSVLIKILELETQGKITITGGVYAYDINEKLINLYKDVKHNKDELYNYTERYRNEYNSSSDKESYYYTTRTKFNLMQYHSVERSAVFLFLNKTCFRGMYREGPNGFNVPYGHYKTTPTIIARDDLDRISNMIQKVNFKHLGFKESMQEVETGDFVYLDPPYAPETKTSFVKYTKEGFTLDDHKLLFSEIIKCNNRGVKFTLSNSKVTLVEDHFKQFNCVEIRAKRAINSKNPGSSAIELIIDNHST